MRDEEIQKYWNEFKELLLSTKRQGIENLIQWLDSTDFKYAPASTQYHNSFRGGLLKHSLNVYYAFKDDYVTPSEFMEIPQDTIIITSLLHDVCKIDCYVESTRNVKDETGQWVTVPYYQYDEVRPWGHGAKSVILILQHGVYLNDVEISMIVNHMGFTTFEDPKRVSKLFRICPQSLLLYNADVEASNILESYEGPQRFIDRLKVGGRSLTECMSMSNKPKTIKIDNMEYELADENAIVDGEDIIEVVAYNGQKVKVYAPYGDGLPF